MNKEDYVNFSEEQLCQALHRKDKKVLEVLYDRYSSALFGIVKRIVVDEEMAKEVLNDAFIKIWQKGDMFDSGKGRLFTWMLNISRNLAIDKIRSRKYKEGQKTDSVTNNVYTIDQQRYDEQHPDDIGVRDLLSTLNEDQKAVIDLLFFKGYTQSEVAKAYGIPLGTVKTRARAALRSLRKYLKR